MNFKKYHLFFHSNSIQKLSFNLIDTPVTNLWINCLEESICKDIIDVKMYFEGSAPDIENHIELLVNIISKEHIDILKFWKKPLDRQVMNLLHQYLHNTIDHISILSKKAESALADLNQAIHHWESLVRKPTNNNWAYYRLDSTTSKPITDDLRKYWKIDSAPPGSLRLGYYTLGKDLWTCFLDKDSEVIKNKLVRPQLAIHTQVFFRIEEIKLPLPPELILRKFDEWCEENNTIAHGVNPNDPIHRTGMKPLLGVAENLPSTKEIVNMWSTAKKITWTLE